ncbi:hypothetical protein A3F37_01810 [Candidatus Saccharibacteria bacterium RIFCSPHIGHO2_12_FULL_41_12]|nr:MAG: hypothetical protein A3F37_01810 [Candidatus Saccharibacteria bacterium RIFCSPHIGHO2_12_FULL_41_12]
MSVSIRTKILSSSMASLIIVVSLLNLAHGVKALALSSRSVAVGSSKSSEVTSHRFDFTLSTMATMGSIEFEYCENNPFVGTACSAPPGLSLSGVALGAQSGETGFSVDGSSTANKVVLTRPSILATPTAVSYTLTNAVNPSENNKTVYVRISTFSTVDGTGPRTDSGAVVFSTASGISVDGFVPPYLTLCVGVTVDLTCQSASGTQLDFGEFSTKQTRSLTSQFAAATNDPGGYSMFVAGPTMTSGSNIIPALATSSSSQIGKSQFGMNLRANSNPSVGSDSAGVGTAVPTAGFAVPNQFSFNNQIVALSPLSTEFNRFTASYIVNISPSQSPGIYNTTLTYIATAAF